MNVTRKHSTTVKNYVVGEFPGGSVAKAQLFLPQDIKNLHENIKSFILKKITKKKKTYQ